MLRVISFKINSCFLSRRQSENLKMATVTGRLTVYGNAHDFRSVLEDKLNAKIWTIIFMEFYIVFNFLDNTQSKIDNDNQYLGKFNVWSPSIFIWNMWVIRNVNSIHNFICILLPSIKRKYVDAFLMNCQWYIHYIDNQNLVSIKNSTNYCFGFLNFSVTCQRQPALGCVYKLVEINEKPKIKLSQDVEKVTMPGKKTAFRLYR